MRSDLVVATDMYYYFPCHLAFTSFHMIFNPKPTKFSAVLITYEIWGPSLSLSLFHALNKSKRQKHNLIKKPMEKKKKKQKVNKRECNMSGILIISCNIRKVSMIQLSQLANQILFFWIIHCTMSMTSKK